MKHFIRISSFAIFILSLFVFAQNVSAQTRKTVHFEKGETSATLRDRVSGYDYINYLVRANSGQTISVELHGKPMSPVFSIFLPGGDNLEGAAQSNDFSGEVPASGTYVVRVGLMRAYARRKQSSNFTLKISIQ